MDYGAMIEYLPLYGHAALLTLRIGWIGIAGSIAIGLASALVTHFRIPVLHGIARAYIELFRNTPLLIQLFFIYFGLPRLGVPVDAEFCGCLGLSLLGGAYMAETFRSGLEAVEPGQTESALSLGMSTPQVMRHIVLPQAVALSIQSFVANVVFLLKETSVFSAISLLDLMFVAKDLIGLYYDTTECLVMLVIFYLMIILPVSIAGTIVERRLRHGAFGA
ncbi:polar amino acid ABC transporter permease [Berryella intestinalis]|uniref:Polar amino acid ABC transporter permease n=1 Tax=Berryella intestinalis TaxID=1531429 RepID=A0A0A8B5S0_9ACTN|nr:amino acid ABC transporter permease [Berryella intestinalis]AJC12138.1 polar amino acid ABC transporter permease [Berryella intestinalis]